MARDATHDDVDFEALFRDARDEEDYIDIAAVTGTPDVDILQHLVSHGVRWPNATQTRFAGIRSAARSAAVRVLQECKRVVLSQAKRLRTGERDR